MGIRGTLGTLFIELAANTARLQGDMGKAVAIAERGASMIKKAFTFAAGGAGAGLITSFLVGTAKNAIKLGDDLQKAAAKAGIGGKAISELAYAAKLADVDLAALSTSIKKMQVTLSEAGTGAKGPIQTLAALGLTFQDLQKRKPEAQFELLADRISKLTDPADRTRAAVEIFGKAGADLLPLFEQGAAGIAKARAEAEKLGLSFSGETLKRMGDADDAAKRLSASWEGFAVTLTAKVGPAISTVLDRLSGLDTRSTGEKIADLERSLMPRRGLMAQDRARMEAELANLRGMAELEKVRGLQTGTSGGPTGRVNTLGLPLGFAGQDAEEAAKAAAKKAADAALKERDRLEADYRDMIGDLNRMVDAEADKTLEKDMDRWMERQDAAREWAETYAEEWKRVQKSIDDQARQISEPARIMRDTFLNAFDDMVNTGKIKWDELLKYLVAEFARMGIAKLFNTLGGAGSGAGGGSSGGFWGFLGSLFGGGFAAGGDAAPNKIIEVGERGRELMWTGGRGAHVIPNHALGGSLVVAPQITINAPGATVDAIKLLPRMAEQISKVTEERIVERLARNAYPALRK